MDLINNPEFKAKYDKCKKIIKRWEMEFRKKNGRIPSKYDIRDADSTIKNAYKKYFQMKTDALNDSLNDIDNFFADTACEQSQVYNELNESIQTGEIINTIKDLQPTETEEIRNTQELKGESENVWGSHLNKEAIEINLSTDSKSSSNLTRKLSEKIFIGSKFSKRNPRKSMSFTRQKSKIQLDELSNSQSIDESSQFIKDIETQDNNVDSYTIENCKIQENKTNLSSKAVNFLQIAANTDMVQLKCTKNVDQNWLNRVSIQNGLRVEKVELQQQEIERNYGLSNINTENLHKMISTQKSSSARREDDKICLENEDVIGNSESENEDDISVAHIRKKRRLLTKSFTDANRSSFLKSSISSLKKDIEKTLANTNEFTSHQNTNIISKTINIPPSVSQNSILKEVTLENIPVSTNNVREPAPNRKQKVKKMQKPIRKTASKLENASRKSLKRRVKTIGLQQTNTILENLADDEDEDPFNADSDNDPNFDLNDSKNNLDADLSSIEKTPLIGKIKTVKTKKEKIERKLKKEPQKKVLIKRQKSKENESEIESGPTDLRELYRTNLPETVPRFKILKKTKLLSTESKVSPEKENTNQLSVNRDNFVRLNMKKKVFVRGKKTMTFSKYQKSKWLAKKKAQSLAGPDMDMRGCDGGELRCFTCNQVGHMARQCKALKGENLLPLEADNEEKTSPFATLEEAYETATKSKLSVHVPNTGDSQQSNAASSEYDNMFNDNPIDMHQIDELMNVIENSSSQIKENQTSDNSYAVQPLYESIPSRTPQEVFDALNYFGFKHFRFGQERAILRILSGLSTLVILSTGSGKSLIYQLPAYMYNKYRSPSIALVVSPLISLMEDQAAQSERIVCLHTGMTPVVRKQVLDRLKDGTIDALLISPEAVVTSVDTLIRNLPAISFVCIDEVHCVSQWSHNFRPSYLTLCRVLRERFGVKVILGLTATAPLTTQRSIVSHLGIQEEMDGVVGEAPLPDNLTLTVSKDFKRDSALIAILQSERLKDYKSIVIYCTKRDDCERLAAMLRTYFQDNSRNSGSKKRKRVSWSAEPYHAGLSASRRRTIQRTFMSGELKIVVATVAFGMGINKSDIRAVIHYNMPRNFESYVQEVGRAGRDGLPAHCHLFLDNENNDQNELRRHIYANSIDRHVIRKLLQKVFVPCECKSRGITCPKHEVAFSIEETVRHLDIPEENISTLLCYLELHEQSFVQVLSSAYTWCKVISYAGPSALRQASINCAPLAMAIAMEIKNGKKVDKMNSVEFPVVEIAAAIGWESGMVKHYLKNLEWITENGLPKRSTISVELSSLGFRLRAAGDLSSNDLDMALDYLHLRVQKQEKTALVQLQKSYEAFKSVATDSFITSDDEAIDRSNKIKSIILNYFQSEQDADNDYQLKFGAINENLVAQDVRSMISMYPNNNFTGRAIARIFYGIPSPNYPAVMWGRCKYWRSHLKLDFNVICKIATQEILRMR